MYVVIVGQEHCVWLKLARNTPYVTIVGQKPLEKRLLLARDNMYVDKGGQGHHVNGYSWPGTP